MSVSVLLLSESGCGLGKGDINSPEHCVNKEQFDQNMISRWYFQMSLVCHSRI